MGGRPSTVTAWLLIPATVFVCLPCTAAPVAGAAKMPGVFGLSLEELGRVEVVTPSRKAEPVDRAPNVTYVIPAGEIQRRGFTTLRQVLETVPGFAVFHRDLQFVAQVRGIAPNDNEKITVMINGHSINQVFEPEVLGGALPLDNLERIEIIVGPGSVLYGADTLAAIVNLITRDQNYVETTVRGNTREGVGATYTAGREYGRNRRLFVSASYRRHDGFDAWLPDASNERNRRLAGTEATGLLHPSITLFGSGAVGGWSFQSFLLNSQMPELHLLGNGVAEDGRRYDYLSSTVIRNVTPWTGRVSTRFEVFGDFKRVLRSIVRVGDQGTGLFPNWDISQSVYGGEFGFQVKTRAHYVQAGVQSQVKQHRHNYDFQWSPEDPAAPSQMRSIVRITDTWANGVYVSEEYALRDDLRFIGAVRFDRDGVVRGDRFYASPRLAVVYAPAKRWTVKVMHNKATRMPAPFGSPLNTLWGLGNPNAPDWANANPNADRPETLTATEIQNIVYAGNTRIALNLYRQRLEDFITWYSPWTNVGDFDGHGGELAVCSRLGSRLVARFNGSYSDNEFTTRGSMTESQVGSQRFQLPANDRGEVVAAPKWMANAGVEWELLGGVFLCPTVRWFTHQPMFRREAWTYANDRAYLDAALTWEGAFDKPMDLRLTGRNLLDNRDPVGAQWLADAYRPEGRSVEVALGARF